MRKLWVVLRERCTVVAIKLSEESAKKYAEENKAKWTLKIQEFDWVDAYPRRRRSVYGILKPKKDGEPRLNMKDFRRNKDE